nr:PREDICTED: myosin regulatory light chain 2, atrial isoform-like [Apteryx mantelli mantelli]
MPRLGSVPKELKIEVAPPGHPRVLAWLASVTALSGVSAPGKLNVSDGELEEMLKEGKGPINFTVFLTLFGEKLNGTDPEESILNAFKLFDPAGTGTVNKDEFKQLLLTQADKFSPEEVEQMFAVTPIDVAGNIDYKSLCYIITHGDEKED